MKEDVLGKIRSIVAELYPDFDTTGISIDEPDEQFGDYSCNVAMKMAKEFRVKPRDIADKISSAINESNQGIMSDVAGAGFINIRLSDEQLIKWIQEPSVTPNVYSDQKVLIEYSDPNPFKPLHAGHLYTTLVGDSIARIVEYAGAEVIRINYSGDVGLHVAKCMWGIINNLGEEKYSKLAKIIDGEIVSWLGARYVEGNKAYEDDENSKAEIVSINKRIYELHSENDTTSEFAQIYWKCRELSYEYFKEFYDRLGVKPFDRYIPESEVTPLGLKSVKEQTKQGVYEESNQAVIYSGDKDDLHTRVFINSEGLPTYEAKEVGLILTKWRDYSYDKSIIITANEQEQYMQVVLASVARFDKKAVERTNHLTHGIVKLAGGKKMSSRKGNTLSAVDVISSAEAISKQMFDNEEVGIAIGSIKYSFAKQRIGGDVIYDPESSVSMHGDSGPYLQYALVRAKSIIKKVGQQADIDIDNGQDLDDYERSICRKMQYFEWIVESSAIELSPSAVASYTFELAKTFNKFYEKSPVANNPRTNVRVIIVKKYTVILQECLELLGLEILEEM
ncbi:MAG: arginine--tRNA ligase [Patescibacteria group bacterium]